MGERSPTPLPHLPLLYAVRNHTITTFTHTRAYLSWKRLQNLSPRYRLTILSSGFEKGSWGDT